MSDCRRDGNYGASSATCVESPGPAVLGGYWIWWCETHKRPSPWCEIDDLKNSLTTAQAENEKGKAERAKYKEALEKIAENKCSFCAKKHIARKALSGGTDGRD